MVFHWNNPNGIPQILFQWDPADFIPVESRRFYSSEIHWKMVTRQLRESQWDPTGIPVNTGIPLDSTGINQTGSHRFYSSGILQILFQWNPADFIPVESTGIPVNTGICQTMLNCTSKYELN